MKKYFFFCFVVFVVAFSFTWIFITHNTKKEVAGVAVAQPIRGIILPHHNVAAQLIDSSLSRISKLEIPTLIIMLGPNHFASQKYTIVTADIIDGLSVKDEVSRKLIQTFPLIGIDNTIVNNDHAISVYAPYIKKYFPNAKVVPILFSRTNSKEELEKLASFLANNSSLQTLFLASIDFSHDSSSLEGIDNNKESINILQSFDYKKLLALKDDHMDAPDAAAVLLMTMQLLHTTTWETWHNTHSSILLNNPSLFGTSYVIGVFR